MWSWNEKNFHHQQPLPDSSGFSQGAIEIETGANAPALVSLKDVIANAFARGDNLNNIKKGTP
jgi:hypothetical protein